MCKSLNEIDNEILAILEPENIESNVSYERFNDPERNFEGGDNRILNTKLPKLESPVFKGNRIRVAVFL